MKPGALYLTQVSGSRIFDSMHDSPSMKRLGDVFLADTARVLGDVHLGSEVNVWCHVAIRGDVAPIRVGRGTNIQDGAVVHCDSGAAQSIGRDVTIGHGAIVHGLSVGDGALVGMGARVLGGARIGERALIAAGALVAPGTEIPPEHLAVGVPARIRRPITGEARAYLAWLAPHYVELARLHAEQPEDPRVRPYGA